MVCSRLGLIPQVMRDWRDWEVLNGFHLNCVFLYVTEFLPHRGIPHSHPSLFLDAQTHVQDAFVFTSSPCAVDVAVIFPGGAHINGLTPKPHRPNPA